MTTIVRLRLVLISFVIVFSVIVIRLFYWQIIKGKELSTLAKDQYFFKREVSASRGEILSSDQFPLAGNKRVFLLYGLLNKLNKPSAEVADKLAPILFSSEREQILNDDNQAKKEKESFEDFKKKLVAKLNQVNLVWVALQRKVSQEQRDKILDLGIEGLGFEEEEARFYPEASMAAHLLGFVGKNTDGQDLGYFGLEGHYDLELKGRAGVIAQEKDADNKPILIGGFLSQDKRDGQSLVLYLNRSLQFMVEEKLKKGIEKYGAKSGWVVVLDPKTGGVLVMSSYPAYDPDKYYQVEADKFLNPIIGESYEPGSTFKVMIMSAALDTGVVKKDLACPICDKPIKIDKYIIRTWNNEYRPNLTMKEVIIHSDNIGMVYVGRQLGREAFVEYLKKFGFGEKTNIDLQEENTGVIREKSNWSEIDLATASFGQGMAVTGIQMIQAAAAIANGGKLMQPQVVQSIKTNNGRVKIKPKEIRRVISAKTAEEMAEIMVSSVEEGEAQWTKLKGFRIAGKTGTAQIPVAGHYDEEKTIASFIGFGPVEDPRFAMLVALREPTTSPWGSETAAPLFFSIAKEILIYYGVQPD